MQIHLPSSCLTTDQTVGVVLVGCGATGSEMLDVLWRIHLCVTSQGQAGLQIHVFDPEVVESNNIGKQNFWPAQLGKPKAVAAVEQYNLAGGVSWQGYQHRLEPAELMSEGVLGNVDVVITAVDSPAFRAELGQLAVAEAADLDDGGDAPVLWLDGGVDRNQGQVVLGHLFSRAGGGEGMLPNVYDLFNVDLQRQANVTGRHTGCSSLAASLAAQGLLVNRRCANEMGDLLYRAITSNGHLAHHGVIFDGDRGQMTPLAADPLVWETFGYDQRGEARTPEMSSAL